MEVKVVEASLRGAYDIISGALAARIRIGVATRPTLQAHTAQNSPVMVWVRLSIVDLGKAGLSIVRERGTAIWRPPYERLTNQRLAAGELSVRGSAALLDEASEIL